MMAQTIDFLQRVDAAWRVVLRGNGWVMDDSGKGVAVRVPYSGSVGQTERSVHPFIAAKETGGNRH
jgi:hypothetical protein